MATTYGTIPTSSTSLINPENFEYISRAKERITSSFGDRRPWRQFLGVRSIGPPKGFRDACGRFRTNVAYYRVNYAIVALFILFLSLLWHPVSLIVLVVLMALWVFLYFLRDEALVLFNRTIGDKMVLIVLSVLTIGLLLLTGATSNIVVALLIGGAVVALHAAILKTEDEQDELVPGGGGGHRGAASPSPNV